MDIKDKLLIGSLVISAFLLPLIITGNIVLYLLLVWFTLGIESLAFGLCYLSASYLFWAGYPNYAITTIVLIVCFGPVCGSALIEDYTHVKSGGKLSGYNL